jgi:hypothetical protein
MKHKITSKRVASIAAKTLLNSNSLIEKTLAGSALSQARPRVVGLGSRLRPHVVGLGSRRLGLEIFNRSKQTRRLGLEIFNRSKQK